MAQESGNHFNVDNIVALPSVTPLSGPPPGDSADTFRELGPGLPLPSGVDWRAIHDGQIFVGKIEPNDIRQGLLGDCYFLASLAALSAINEANITKIIVNGQDYGRPGFFGVRWFVNGYPAITWIDDKFPCDTSGNPVFSKAADKELWVLILEKAYAKVHGSYARIAAGFPGDALSDITGMPCSLTRLQLGSRSMIWARIKNSMATGQVLCAGITSSPLRRFFLLGLERELVRLTHVLLTALDRLISCCECGIFLRNLFYCIFSYVLFALYFVLGTVNGLLGGIPYAIYSWVHVSLCVLAIGLVPGHAYSVIDVKSIPKCCGALETKLVRLRNPWGKVEFKGFYSDSSLCWTLRPGVKDAVGFTGESDDGSFWMSFDAFLDYFDRLDSLSIASDQTKVVRASGRITNRTGRVAFTVSETEARDLRVTITQPRRNSPAELYPWRLQVSPVNSPDNIVAQTNHATEFCTECSLSTEPVTLAPGSYLMLIDGHPSSRSDQCLPFDVTVAIHSSSQRVKINGLNHLDSIAP